MPATEDTFLRDLLQGLTDSLVEGEISFDDEGRAAVSLTDELVVGIDHLPESNQILVHAELGTLEAAAGRMLPDLLADSLTFAASWGGALGIDRETGTVALFARRSAAGLGQADFEDWLGEIADAGEAWQGRLRAARDAA